MTAKHFNLTEVRAFLPSTVVMEFADGEVFTLDLRETIQLHPSLATLADPAVFPCVAVGEWGGSLIWAADDNLELAADNLRARAIEQSGECSREGIWNWMARHHLSLDAGAAALGLSRRMLAYYRSGEKPVPRTVALACLGWESQQKIAA